MKEGEDDELLYKQRLEKGCILSSTLRNLPVQFPRSSGEMESGVLTGSIFAISGDAENIFDLTSANGTAPLFAVQVFFKGELQKNILLPVLFKFNPHLRTQTPPTLEFCAHPSKTKQGLEAKIKSAFRLAWLSSVNARSLFANHNSPAASTRGKLKQERIILPKQQTYKESSMPKKKRESTRMKESKKVKESKTAKEQPEQQLVCHSGKIGRRPTMEDEFFTGARGGWEVFAVFDGHGGAITSKTLQQEFGPALLKALSKLPTTTRKQKQMVQKILKDCFRQQEESLFATWKKNPTDMSGSCALVLVRREGDVYVCNLGDSRCILLSDSETFATIDQKPESPEEKQRIVKSGGFVALHEGAHRVNGILASARAFGDFGLVRVNADIIGLKVDGALNLLENPPLSAEPQISYHSIKPGAIALLACDGVFDVLSTEQVIDIIEKAKPLDAQICEKITTQAFEQGSFDNLTALLVQFN